MAEKRRNCRSTHATLDTTSCVWLIKWKWLCCCNCDALFLYSLWLLCGYMCAFCVRWRPWSALLSFTMTVINNDTTQNALYPSANRPVLDSIVYYIVSSLPNTTQHYSSSSYSLSNFVVFITLNAMKRFSQAERQRCLENCIDKWLTHRMQKKKKIHCDERTDWRAGTH